MTAQRREMESVGAAHRPAPCHALTAPADAVAAPAHRPAPCHALTAPASAVAAPAHRPAPPPNRPSRVSFGWLGGGAGRWEARRQAT